jgi:hypothetical protein
LLVLVALLSTLERASDGASCSRAFLRVAGETVIARQVEMALGLGYERIICLAEGLPTELVAVQHRVERMGRKFHAASGRQALHGLISAADEIIVISDGVIPHEPFVADALSARKGVLTMPVEAGLAAGFERLDREQAWAGVLRCRGGDLERLAELPPDIDPVSALMRSALQSGYTRTEVPAELVAQGHWRLIDSATAASDAGQRMVHMRLRPSSWLAPFNALIDRVIRARADAMLRRTSGNFLTLAGSALAIILAMISAAAGYLVASFMILIVAAAYVRSWLALDQLGIAQIGNASSPIRSGSVLVLDLALVTAPLLAGSAEVLDSLAFTLVILIGLLNLARRQAPDWGRAIACDHMLLFALLAFASAADRLPMFAQALALGFLAVLFIRPAPNRLTGA